jgi:DNA-binding NtrC family response regulator
MGMPAILIVDNEKSVVNALKRILWREGYRILTANSGEEALSKMGTFNCQLILADHWMPKMSGIELLALIKEKYPYTIRILITSQIDLDNLNRDIDQYGIYAYITKPWEPEELKTIIRKGLEKYRDSIQNRAYKFRSDF